MSDVNYKWNMDFLDSQYTRNKKLNDDFELYKIKPINKQSRMHIYGDLVCNIQGIYYGEYLSYLIRFDYIFCYNLVNHEKYASYREKNPKVITYLISKGIMNVW